MPTTPRSDQEIENVFGDGVSDAARILPAGSLREEGRRLWAFLRQPTLHSNVTVGKPSTVLARIYAFDMAAMLTLIMAASLVVAMGVSLPQTALAGIEFTPLIVIGVILLAPVSEEIIFRSWISGKPAQVFALLLGVMGAGAVFSFYDRAPLISGTVAFGAVLAAFAVLILLRNRPTLGWFNRQFPVFFWLSTVAFALVHVTNFEVASDWSNLVMILPLVLPQFILGALLGYIRVRIGLWAAIVLHAGHNATAIGISALAMAFE
ncbi:MAG: CPBP family glutamic-type intramembrane protease [Erythrobacter sp.]